MPPKGSRKTKGDGAADGVADEDTSSSAAKRRKLQVVGNDEELEAALKPDNLASEEAPQENNDEEKTVKEKKEKKDKKDKKEKKEKKEKKAEAEGEDPAELAAESDTEYGAFDFATCPETLQVNNSGHPKVDGTYARLDKLSRGRPCYSKEGRKTIYLFWHKKNQWKISNVLGSDKFFARVDGSKDSNRRVPPCEPYPFAWKVIVSDEKDKENNDNDQQEGKSKKTKEQVSAPMRVIDAATLDQSADAMLNMEPDAWKRKGSKKKEKDRKSTPSGKASAGAAAGDGQASATASAAAAAAAGGGAAGAAAAGTGEDFDEEAAAAEAAAGGDSDSEDEDGEGKKEASEDSSSESDSDSDSSSSSGAESQPKPPPAQPKAAQPSAPSASPAAASSAAASSTDTAGGAATPGKIFATKLRAQLEGIKDPKHRQTKLQQVRQKADHILKACGMTKEELKELIDALERDFAPKPKAAAKPQVVPPKYGQNRAKPGQGADGAVAGAAPSTPPVDQLNASARRSCIKRKNGPSRHLQGRIPRISWPQHNNTHVVQVQSFRGLGEQLWYHMPGAMVFCDNCDKQVPQSMGVLQGEPTRPQFAQNQFLCSDCLHLVASQQLNMGMAAYS